MTIIKGLFLAESIIIFLIIAILVKRNIQNKFYVVKTANRKLEPDHGIDLDWLILGEFRPQDTPEGSLLSGRCSRIL